VIGAKGGGGQVGLGSGTNKGPRPLGGKHKAGGRVKGGGTHAALARAAGGGKKVSITGFQRQAGGSRNAALAALDGLVAAGKAQYAFMSEKVASTLKSHGQDVAYREGKPIRGIELKG